MSKTKEEIIAENVRFNGVCDTINYHGAMDQYASQVLSEYKEKLKVKIERTELLNRAAKHHVYNLIDFV